MAALKGGIRQVGQKAGKILAARFRQAPEKLYSEIIDLLLNTPTPEDEEES